MNGPLLLFLFLMGSIIAHGQNVTENEIVGKWNVKRIVQKPSAPDFAPIIDGFANGIFMFKGSGDFGFTTSSQSVLFADGSVKLNPVKT